MIVVLKHGVEAAKREQLIDWLKGQGLTIHISEGEYQTVLGLVGAGGIMVVALATSRKARQVTQTAVGLSAQSQGDEMFGSSRLGRKLVRAAINANGWMVKRTPQSVRDWVERRMNSEITQEENGAAFDLVRASVNLMLAAILIAVGTSLRLPLSTTFVTFMVAMGTSLADRAWGR